MNNKPAEVTVAQEALKEIKATSPSETKLVISFIERLAANPYDPSVLEAADAKGDLFAASVTKNLNVYWSLGEGNKGKSRKSNSQPTISIIGLVRNPDAVQSFRTKSPGKA